MMRSFHKFESEWVPLTNLYECVLTSCIRYPESIDLKLIQAVGRNLPAVVRNQLIMLEPMMENNMLNEFYVDGLGMPEYIKHLARMVSQIGHRFPNMKVLEIGKQEYLCHTAFPNNHYRCWNWWSNKGNTETTLPFFRELHFHGYFSWFF